MARKKSEGDSVLLFVISAPSGAGKTSLCRRVLEQDKNLSFSVSHTTRPARPGEKEGVDYHFVDEKKFDKMVKEGRFLEWANVYGKRYGTSKGEIERAEKAGKDLLIEIDCQGAEQLRRVLPRAVGIFIVPPSLEALRERLSGRGTESEKEISRRLSIATGELADYKNFHYAVVNDDFEEAAKRLMAVITAERNRTARRRDFIESLLKKAPKVR